MECANRLAPTIACRSRVIAKGHADLHDGLPRERRYSCENASLPDHPATYPSAGQAVSVAAIVGQHRRGSVPHVLRDHRGEAGHRRDRRGDLRRRSGPSARQPAVPGSARRADGASGDLLPRPEADASISTRRSAGCSASCTSIRTRRVPKVIRKSCRSTRTRTRSASPASAGTPTCRAIRSRRWARS